MGISFKWKWNLVALRMRNKNKNKSHCSFVVSKPFLKKLYVDYTSQRIQTNKTHKNNQHLNCSIFGQFFLFNEQKVFIWNNVKKQERARYSGICVEHQLIVSLLLLGEVHWMIFERDRYRGRISTHIQSDMKRVWSNIKWKQKQYKSYVSRW